MRAGKLRHRLIVERSAPTRDEFGDEVPGWALVDTVWAAVEPLSGREATNAGQLLATLDTRITIRWSPSVDPITEKWRLRHPERSNPTTYDVQSVAHLNLGRREIQILAKSGVNAG